MSRKRGSKAAESRYTKLRLLYDNDLFNRTWKEIDVNYDDTSESHYFEFIDLFSGAGGISRGLAMAGYNKLLSNEIDPDASATIRRNFANSIHVEGPVERLVIKDHLPHMNPGTVALVIGGPPCQGFSVAGYRKNEDPRNQLYRHFLRIVDEVKPWFVVIENVPGILTLGGGKYKEMILEDLRILGYQASVRILEAAEFGVAQLRSRAIFIGNRFGYENPYPKPFLTPGTYVPIEQVIADLETMTPDPSTNHEWTKHRPEMESRLASVKPGQSLYESFRDAWKRQHLGVPAMTIKENHGGTHIHPRLNRVLSAREMARLQGFPDGHIFCGTMKRAMWQIGNAVPPVLAKYIGLALVPTLQEIKKNIVDGAAPSVHVIPAAANAP